MALAGVLSAMRELVLDIDEIPSEYEKRLAFYRSRFTTLTDHELEDLAKVPGEKFKIYTATVFSGEANVLENHFSMSLQLLKKHWHTITGQKFNAYRFARRLHKSRPWQSNTTIELAENFCAHIEKDIPELKKLAPEIYDVAKCELLTLRAKRAPDEPMMQNQLEWDAVTTTTIEKLLGLQFQIPQYAVFTQFEFDVVKAFWSFHSQKRELPESIEKTSVYAACSRNKNLKMRWIEPTPKLWNFLNSQHRSTNIALSSVAQICIEAAEANTAEEEVLKGFLGSLKILMESGVIQLPLS